VGDFRFCMLRKEISPESEISGINAFILNAKYAIRRFCGSPARWYGLENSSAIIEYVPLFAKTRHTHKLTRVPMASNTASMQLSAPSTSQNDDDDQDFFADEMRTAREEATRHVATSVIGGDTASFKPLVLSDDDEDADDE
jgi:KUP system potassium uptake protein